MAKEVAMGLEVSLELRFQKQALEALQHAAETYLTHLFEDSLLLAVHAKRKTVFDRDMKLAQRLRGEVNCRTVTYDK